MTRLMLAVLVFGAGAWLGASASAAPPADPKPLVRAGFVEFPPFKYADEDGKASGPWVAMTEKVAAEAGYRVDWVHLPIARVYLYLKTGKIDFWPGVANIPAIQGHVLESAVTPMRVVLHAFHRRGTEPPASLQALQGQPLILINGFSYLGALQSLSLDKDDLSYAPDHASALRMLELGRGQYILDYDAPVQAVRPKFPDLALTGTPIFEARGAFIVSRAHPDAKTIIQHFDQAYGRLIASGELSSLQSFP